MSKLDQMRKKAIEERERAKRMAGKRLMKDLKELNESLTPILGISAQPLENSIFTWHGNFRGGRSTVYQNSLIHFKLEFTDHYPFVPPKISILSPHDPHPCIVGETVQDEIFKITSNKQYEGWVSAYSVESILLELQCFLLNYQGVYRNEAYHQNKDLVSPVQAEANLWECKDIGCKHRGFKDMWPQVNDINEECKDKNFVKKED